MQLRKDNCQVPEYLQPLSRSWDEGPKQERRKKFALSFALKKPPALMSSRSSRQTVLAVPNPHSPRSNSMPPATKPGSLDCAPLSMLTKMQCDLPRMPVARRLNMDHWHLTPT